MPRKNTGKDKKNRPSKTSHWYLIAIIAAVVALIVLLVMQFASFSGFDTSGPMRFQITDQCSVFVGKLIHTINNEGQCIQQCITDCDSKGLDYENATFKAVENDCNSCSCSCS